MVELLMSPWAFEVERGPDCLFVRVTGEPHSAWSGPSLAEELWLVLEKHLSNRLVLECERIGPLSSALLSELIALQERVASRGGMLRVCGLSDANREVLRRARLDGRLCNYADRTAAVMSQRPAQPR